MSGGPDRRDFLRHVSAVTAAALSGALSPAALAGAGAAARAAGTSPPGLRPVPLPEHLLGRAMRPVDGPWQLTLAEAAVAIRRRELSPVELAEALVTRIGAWDATLQAFNHVDPGALVDAARAAERGPVRGALHGIPLAIKDNFHTAGVPTTANSRIFEGFVPEHDAEAWRRLKERGALLAGKTQMGPLATSRATTWDGHVTTRNAWAPDDASVSPGGSSSGSATAVAARLAMGATGTQTGGSITNPAAAQGLTGLKPTLGLVSLRGVIPLTYTRDHVGPLARDAMDAAILLQAMAGADAGDPRTLGLPRPGDWVTAATPVRRRGATVLRGAPRIGVPPGWLDRDDGTRADFLAVLGELGARVVEVPPPADWDVLTSGALNNVRLVERAEPFLEHLQADVRDFGVSLGPWINGLLLAGTEYLHGQRAKLLLLERLLDDSFGRCDLWLQESSIPFDMVGLPLISFPIGMRDAGDGPRRLPMGVLVGGPPFSEGALLGLAAAWQDVTTWHLEESVAARMAAPVTEGSTGVPDSGLRLDLYDVEREAE